jgi:DNA-binding NtrC family response regulator
LGRSRILSVSCNANFLAARHVLLERAGFDVTSVASTFDALDLLNNHKFSAAVIGYEFSFTERQLFAADVGERCGIPVIMIRGEDYSERGEFLSGEALVRTLQSALAERAKRSA